MTYDSEKLRETMRMWLTGVTIVTTQNGDLARGMTVSSFTSVTLEPPLILICLQKQTETAQAILESGSFAVSMLGADQEYLSNLFAGFIPLKEGEDRFEGLELIYAASGAPILHSSMGWLDCRVHSVLDGSTHHIFMGEVLEASGFPADGSIQAPLLYYNRGYRRLAD